MLRAAAFLAIAVIACGGTAETTGPGVDASLEASVDASVDGGADPDAADAASDPAIAAHAAIHHVIVIVKENHTFDNYFGSFPKADGTNKYKLLDGTVRGIGPAPDNPRDLCHKHDCALADWNHGAMNGWENTPTSNQNGDYLAWAQYSEKDIPNYWAYAKAYALGDHYFANMMGPSYPGHMFYLAAQAGWALDNPPIHITHPYWGCDGPGGDTVPILDKGTCTVKDVFPCAKIPSLPDVLPQGVNWKFYGSNFYLLPEIWSMFDGIDSIRNGPGWKNIVPNDDFFTDIKNHTLPNVVWLVDQDLADEHPGIPLGGVCKGENWTVGRVNALMQSEYWKDSVVFYTTDDFGGWYDHLPPPRHYGCDDKTPYGLGFRLPLIIMSPFVKPGTIYNQVAEQASIPRFIERVFYAPALSTLDPAAQDGQANDLLDAFNFAQKPNPPLVLTERNCP